MLRLAFARSAGVTRVASHISPSAFSARIAEKQFRCQSTGSRDSRSKKPSDDVEALRKDWDAQIITYEELKPKTTQPSAVSRQLVLRHRDLSGTILAGQVFD